MTGLDSERDGVVFLTDRVSLDNQGEASRAKVDGKTVNLVLRGRGWRGDYLTVFPPGGGESDLVFDEEEEVSTDDLKAIYLSQMEKGVQDDLARFNRTKHEAEAMKALAGLDAEASEACGSAIATAIDWSTVDDALLMNGSVNGYCGVVASEMGSLCEKSPRFKSMSGELEAIECSCGERLNIRNDKSRISFTTHKEEPNQQVFVQSYFRNM